MYKIAGLLLLSLVMLLLLPYLLYWLLWLYPERGLPPKTAGHLEHAGKIRRAERIWAFAGGLRDGNCSRDIQ
jgi:hypothetical protein